MSTPNIPSSAAPNSFIPPSVSKLIAEDYKRRIDTITSIQTASSKGQAAVLASAENKKELAALNAKLQAQTSSNKAATDSTSAERASIIQRSMLAIQSESDESPKSNYQAQPAAIKAATDGPAAARASLIQQSMLAIQSESTNSPQTNK